MSAARAIESDQQLVRVLQIGVVLEELIEARVYLHYRELSKEDEKLDQSVEDLLLEAFEESGEHRERLESLIDELKVHSAPYGEIEALVQDRYDHSKPEGIDDVLHDQLASEESAFNFYDSVIEAVQASTAEFEIDRDRLLSTLREIRAEEAEGVEEITAMIEQQ